MYKIMLIARAKGGTNQTGQKMRSWAARQGKLAKAHIYNNQ